MNIEPTTTVDDATLAALIGVSARRIRQLVESGDLTRQGKNEFQLGPALRELLDHAAGDGASGELMRERVRATKAAADLREIEVAKARGEVAAITDFEPVQAARFALIRTNLLKVPQRAVLRLLGETDESAFKQVLHDELTAALKTSAGPLELPSPRSKRTMSDALPRVIRAERRAVAFGIPQHDAESARLASFKRAIELCDWALREFVRSGCPDAARATWRAIDEAEDAQAASALSQREP